VAVLLLIGRNPMKVEFAEELRPILEEHESAIQVQATYLPGEVVKERYLNRPFGNAYDFGQQDNSVDI
jgi:hypothetical protein